MITRHIPRYQVQTVFDGAPEKPGRPTHFRITDTQTDSRLATCYLEENAVFIVTALNLVELLNRRRQDEEGTV